MVVLGVDAHKATHTIVAIDEVGRVLDQRRVPARHHGHADAIAWAGRFGQVVWAVEDCRHVTRMLEHDLLAAGASVRRVPPHLTGQHRRARQSGKSDPIDARAIAEAALREPQLTVITTAEPVEHEELAHLVGYRDRLVRNRTRLINALRGDLHLLDPDLAATTKVLTATTVVNRLLDRLNDHTGVLHQLCVEQATDLDALNHRIADHTRQVKRHPLVTTSPLLGIHGCAALTAATIIVHTGDITRFPTEAAFAKITGTAPVPASSGASSSMRLSRSGDRTLNHAFYTISLSQARSSTRGGDIYRAAIARGKPKKAARRILKRNIARHIYRLLHHTATSHPLT